MPPYRTTVRTTERVGSRLRNANRQALFRIAVVIMSTVSIGRAVSITFGVFERAQSIAFWPAEAIALLLVIRAGRLWWAERHERFARKK